MFQKILILLCVSCIFFSHVHADGEDISVNISNTWVELWESVHLDISLDPQILETSQIDIDIEGIENFEVFSQSRSENYSSVNGKVQSEMVLRLDIRPIIEWKHLLWPVTIISGNTTHLADETFFINVGQIQTIWSKSEKQVEPEDTRAIEKGFIHDLREIPFPWWGKLAVIGVFFSLFYLILFLFLSLKWKNTPSEKAVEVWSISSEQSRNEKIIAVLKKLKKSAKDMESSEFFRVYNVYLREIFFRIGVKNALSATLKELKKSETLEENLYFDLFKKSYKYEFSSKNISIDTRKKYVDDLIDLLK